MEHEAYSPTITIRIIYEDLPDLIELQTAVRTVDWRGIATAYVSPAHLCNQAAALAAWSRNPSGECRIEAGSDIGVGKILLRFYTIDIAAHVACQIALSTASYDGCRPETISRLSVEIRTEPALIERFARHLAAVASSLLNEAVLVGVGP